MQTSGNVVVVGSANFDFATYGRHLPRPGETVLAECFRCSPGGKGANQAVAAARSGAPTVFIGAVGRDTFGDQVVRSLKAARVNVDGVKRIAGSQTGIALIVVGEHGRNLISVAPGANALMDQRLVGEIGARLNPRSVVLLQLEIPLHTVTYVARMAHFAGATVILNPAPAQELPIVLTRYVDILVLNELELRSITGAAALAAPNLKLAKRLLSGISRAVIVTLGADGVLLVSANGGRHYGAYQVPVVDTTGAGDTFVGALASRIALGSGLTEAVEYANGAAALKVRTSGAQGAIPKARDVNGFLERMRVPNCVIL